MIMKKIRNLNSVLDELINTFKSEISISNKILKNTKCNKKINKIDKEIIYLNGKLEVCKYIKYFTE